MKTASKTVRLLLPGSLLMAIGAQLLAAFVFIDLGFPSLL
jgi:hypothetical protein